MIEFVEKKEWYLRDLFIGNCYMYPNYMLKDGKEFFICNRREPDEKWKLGKIEEYKEQLIETNGAYFRFYSFYKNPFDMIGEMASRGHHFEKTTNFHQEYIENTKFVDFRGNRKEVSATFHYRIYDSDIEKTIRRAVELLNDEKFIECESFISNYF